MKRGFTLVEVLLATTILTLGLTALLVGASHCMAVIRQAKEYQMAQWALNRGEAEHPPVATAKAEDLTVEPEEFEDGLTYSREVEEDEDKDELYVVREKVSWSARGKTKVEEVVRYVLVHEDTQKAKSP